MGCTAFKRQRELAEGADSGVTGGAVVEPRSLKSTEIQGF